MLWKEKKDSMSTWESELDHEMNWLFQKFRIRKCKRFYQQIFYQKILTMNWFKELKTNQIPFLSAHPDHIFSFFQQYKRK